jgi:hypothetical protein
MVLLPRDSSYDLELHIKSNLAEVQNFQVKFSSLQEDSI